MSRLLGRAIDNILHRLAKAFFCWAVFLLCTFSSSAIALDRESSKLDYRQILHDADKIRSADPAQFKRMLELVDANKNLLGNNEKELLSYLSIWYSAAFLGRTADSIDEFESLFINAKQIDIKFRTAASLVNVFVMTRRSEKAFIYLANLEELLPNIKNADFRDQGLVSASMLLNLVAQYDKAIEYTERVTSTSGNPRSLCMAGQLKIEALFRSGRLEGNNDSTKKIINLCEESNETIFANLVRIFDARALLRTDPNAALSELLTYRDEVLATKYPYIISLYEATTALVQLKLGKFQDAQESALVATRQGIKDEFTETLVIAYKVLYEVAIKNRNSAEALHYHMLYANADKGYINEISARQIAFQLAKHNAEAAKLEIEALNKQNKLLNLQDALKSKTVETFRLYLALLLLSLAFILFWTYRTKRLQMHFMKLSRQDSLTGIINRHFLIESADQLFERVKKTNAVASLVIMDLDHFKQVNDQYGHLVGDIVLTTVVNTLKPLMSARDLFGRLGGEEFGFVFSDCDVYHAKNRTELLRAAVENMRATTNKVELRITASFGISSTSDSGFVWRELVTSADSALYRAKYEGRNRVVHVCDFVDTDAQEKNEASEKSTRVVR
jgi:diguanylate cyclase (GGDEF)-like protein